MCQRSALVITTACFSVIVTAAATGTSVDAAAALIGLSAFSNDLPVAGTFNSPPMSIALRRTRKYAGKRID